MGAKLEALNWSKFPNEEAAEGKRWVPFEDAVRAGAEDERALRVRIADLKAKLAKCQDSNIKALREAVALTREDVVAENDRFADNDVQVTEEHPMTQTQETTIRAPSGAATRPTSLLPSPPAGTQSRPWNLGGGTIMTVTIPNTLTPKNIEKLRKYVDALASEASIAWDDDTHGDQGDA